MIKVKFFASLREKVGRAELQIEADRPLTAADIWHRCAPGLSFDDGVLVALNHEYVARGQAVRDGDEVAFFPPVTGG